MATLSTIDAYLNTKSSTQHCF